MEKQKPEINEQKEFKYLSKTRKEGGDNRVKEVLYTASITAIWAEEDSIKAIVEGLKKNELYETTGPLIHFLFFGGWDFPDDFFNEKDFVKKAYKIGVAMGGELKVRPDNTTAPVFIVKAFKDPNSTNLERIQIVKGWYDNDSSQEKVYDVAVANKCKPKIDKQSQIDKKADAQNADNKNKIGENQLSAIWTDPDFDPSQLALYYARVLEIPSPRRVEHDTKELGDATPEIVSDSIQGRAWTSPISYSPNKKSQ